MSAWPTRQRTAKKAEATIRGFLYDDVIKDWVCADCEAPVTKLTSGATYCPNGCPNPCAVPVTKTWEELAREAGGCTAAGRKMDEAYKNAGIGETKAKKPRKETRRRS
jgi:hypothetical protein